MSIPYETRCALSLLDGEGKGVFMRALVSGEAADVAAAVRVLRDGSARTGPLPQQKEVDLTPLHEAARAFVLSATWDTGVPFELADGAAAQRARKDRTALFTVVLAIGVIVCLVAVQARLQRCLPETLCKK